MINFKYITTLEQYEQGVEELKAYLALAADTESYCLPEWEGKGGSALDPHTGRISLVILRGRGSCSYVFDIVWLDHHGCDYVAFKDLLFSREYLLFQNAKHLGVVKPLSQRWNLSSHEYGNTVPTVLATVAGV